MPPVKKFAIACAASLALAAGLCFLFLAGPAPPEMLVTERPRSEGLASPGSAEVESKASKEAVKPRPEEREVAGDAVPVPTGAARILGTLRAKGQESFKPFQILVSSRRGRGEMESFFGSPQSDPTGKFEVEVSPGIHVLKAMVPGFAPRQSPEIKVKAGERVEGITLDLQAGGMVRGVVVLRGSGAPVGGAQVSYKSPSMKAEPWEFDWNGTSATTEPDGSFALEGVAPGVVDLFAYHAEYAQGGLSGVQVREGATAQVTIVLGAGGGVRGTVTRGGKPVSGGQVALRRTDGALQIVKDSMTDAQGRFEIKGLSAGDYILSLMPPAGRGTRTSRMVEKQSVTIIEGQVSEVEIADDEAAFIHLTGRVTSGGELLRGGRIQVLEPERGFGGDQCQIDSNGYYSLELPSPSTYFLMVQRKGEGGVKLEVTIPEGNEFHHDIELARGEISGEVVDAGTSAAIAGAQVVALPAGATSRSLMSLFKAMQAMAPTDSSGQFVISDLPPGTYSVLAVAQGYADGRMEGLQVDDRHGLRDIRIHLETGIRFRIRIVDRQGQPVSQAMAILRDQNGELVPFSRRSFSGTDGVLEFSSVRPAVYQMTVLHRSYAPVQLTVRAAQEGDEPTLIVRPGGKVSVHVSNRENRPVEGSRVELLNEKGENVAEEFFLFDGPIQSTLTLSDGSLVVGPVVPGTYRAVATKGKARSEEERFSAPEGETVEVNLHLDE